METKCTEKGSVSESVGEILYSGTTYSGAQRSRITEKNGQVMNSTAKIKGVVSANGIKVFLEDGMS